MHNTRISGYRKRQCRPVGLTVDDITPGQSVRYAATAATGLCSAEVEVLEGLLDWEIHAALLSQPKEFRMAIYCADVEDFSYAQSAARWCRGCIEDAHDYANRFLHSQRNVEFFETDNFRVTGFSLKIPQSQKVGAELG